MSTRRSVGRISSDSTCLDVGRGICRLLFSTSLNRFASTTVKSCRKNHFNIVFHLREKILYKRKERFTDRGRTYFPALGGSGELRQSRSGLTDFSAPETCADLARTRERFLRTLDGLFEARA